MGHEDRLPDNSPSRNAWLSRSVHVIAQAPQCCLGLAFLQSVSSPAPSDGRHKSIVTIGLPSGEPDVGQAYTTPLSCAHCLVLLRSLIPDQALPKDDSQLKREGRQPQGSERGHGLLKPTDDPLRRSQHRSESLATIGSPRLLFSTWHHPRRPPRQRLYYRSLQRSRLRDVPATAICRQGGRRPGRHNGRVRIALERVAGAAVEHAQAKGACLHGRRGTGVDGTGCDGRDATSPAAAPG